MANLFVIQDGHLSLEYDYHEHDVVKLSIFSIDPNYKSFSRIASHQVLVNGEYFVSDSDPMGCALISGSDHGDDILRKILEQIQCGS